LYSRAAIRDSQKKTKWARKVGEATDDREERTWVEGTGKAHTSRFYVNPFQPFLSDSFLFSIANAI
jgi:hypothetical protein